MPTTTWTIVVIGYKTGVLRFIGPMAMGLFREPGMWNRARRFAFSRGQEGVESDAVIRNRDFPRGISVFQPFV